MYSKVRTLTIRRKQAMKIIIDRVYKYPKYTIGEVYVNGDFYCYSLEDVDRGLHTELPMRYFKERKVYGETAIPRGIYEVVIDWSVKFKKYMPHVLWRNADGKLVEVPGFSGIRLHSLASSKDTLGCIGFGDWKGGDRLYGSPAITSNLVDKINNAWKAKDKIILEVR